MSLTRKILFTVVFTLYCAIFYVAAYYLVSWYDPSWLVPPARIDSEYLTRAVVVFTAVVFLAYLGASYIVFGRLLDVDPRTFDTPDYFARNEEKFERGRRRVRAAAEEYYADAAHDAVGEDAPAAAREESPRTPERNGDAGRSRARSRKRPGERGGPGARS